MLLNFFKKIVPLLPQIIASLFLVGFMVFAWTEPSSAPPLGNVPAPLNVGNVGQSKEDGLILNTGGADMGLIVQQGTSTFAGKVGIEAIPSGTTGSYTLNWNRLEICQFGTCSPPWQDMDGDGRTYMARNDCDEGCATCYVGSQAGTPASDGKDQDCDAIVDELAPAVPPKICALWQWSVSKEAITAACATFCASQGTTMVSATCSRERFVWGGDGYFIFNFTTCQESDFDSEVDATYCESSGNTATCTCARDQDIYQ